MLARHRTSPRKKLRKGLQGLFVCSSADKETKINQMIALSGFSGPRSQSRVCQFANKVVSIGSMPIRDDYVQKPHIDDPL
jgi:hypothetical protein